MFIMLIIDKFESYDYGILGNYMHYKQAQPITYDLGKINASLLLFYGANDDLQPKLVNAFLFFVFLISLN